jgi:hypothetical protein
MDAPAPTMKKVTDFNLAEQWKTYLLILLMVLMSGLLLRMNSKIGQLQEIVSAIDSRDDAIESVVLSTDEVISKLESKVAKIDANIAYIHQKVRRR